MMIMVAGNDVYSHSMKLVTGSSDGAAVCAMDPPTMNARIPQGLIGVPDVVFCGMSCKKNVACRCFNYISTESLCQLYNYMPKTFDVIPHCQHYSEPGQQFFLLFYFTAELDNAYRARYS